jgi:hypothetical protein
MDIMNAQHSTAAQNFWMSSGIPACGWIDGKRQIPEFKKQHIKNYVPWSLGLQID